jgi:hypothetical protein
MKLILVRTKNGTVIGEVNYHSSQLPTTLSNKLDLSTIYYPALVDFITIPMQGRMGQQVITTLTNITSWPVNSIKIDFLEAAMYSIFTDDPTDTTVNAKFIELYKQARQGWESSKIVK